MHTISIGDFTTVRHFVAPEKCSEWVNLVLEQRDAWIERMGFYTFGRAWYTEIATGNLPTYHATATATNKLVASLPDFHSMMASAAQRLRLPGGDGPLPARPRRENLGPYWCDAGLHVLGEASQGGGVAHVDLEGLAPYPQAMFDQATAAFSAVLCVAAPAAGGDLLIWPSKRYLADTAESLDVVQTEGLRLPCRTGDLMLFDSFLPHQIDRFALDDNAPWRMTGVLHFLLREEPEPHWEYWF